MTTEKRPQCPHCGVRHRTLTPDQCADRSMSEQTLSDRIRDRAKRRGWKVAHAGRGWVQDQKSGEWRMVTQMAPGWPDLFMLKEGMPHPALAMELKRELEEPDEDQWFWIRLLNACGIPTVVVRPSDLREGRVNAILMGR